jgi:hypothetical protein
MALEMLGLFGVVESILVFVFAGCMGVVGTILWIWMIIDCATKEPSTGNNKIVWILVIIFTHWIGALIYLLVRRPQRIAELGS